MSVQQFDYAQKFKGRVITDPTLKPFIWDNHNFGTTYREPYGHSTVKNNSSQSYVYAQSPRPMRVFELEFSTLIYAGDEEINCPDELNYSKLLAFYLEHGMHKSFKYPHPVYGDLKVRFSEPLVFPNKNSNSKTIQGFTVKLVEVIDVNYLFDKNEDLNGDIYFPCGYYDVEMEYREDTLSAPLGGNHYMVFKDNKPPLRTLKVSVSGLRYFLVCDGIDLSYAPQMNAMLLEIFYVQNRLNKSFYFEYAGELLKVRFKEPLQLTKPMADSGVLPSVVLTLIETPYSQLTEVTPIPPPA